MSEIREIIDTYSNYVVSTDELDFEFDDDDIIGVTVCKIKGFYSEYNRKEDYEELQVRVKTPKGYFRIKDSFSNVLNKNSEIYDLCDGLGYSVENIEDIKGEEVILCVENIGYDVTINNLDVIKDKSFEFKVSVNKKVIKEVNELDIKMKINSID